MNNLRGMVNMIKGIHISIYIFNSTTHAITGSQETVQVVYESHLFEKFIGATYRKT
jgi:hypothetical protein